MKAKPKAKPTPKPTVTKVLTPAPTPRKKPGVAPRVFNDEEIAIVEELSASCTHSQIADYFGIGEVTFRDIKTRQPAIAVVYKKGRARAIKYMAGKLFQAADEGNMAAVMFYLKTQAGWRETGIPVDSANDDQGAPPPILVRFAAKDTTLDMKEVKELTTE